MTQLVLYLALALGVSFACSIMEAVLLSVTPAYVALLEKKKHPAAAALSRLKADIDRPLVAILTMNTVANTAGAAGAGVEAGRIFGDGFLGLFSGALTLAILVFSEIIPKTLGALYWRKLAPAVARTLRVFIWVLWPLVSVLRGLTRLLSRGKVKRSSVSREEMGALAELGVSEGVLAAEESRVLRSLLRFSSLRATDVMTPRTVLFAAQENQTVSEMLQSHQRIGFSRIPIFKEKLDDVTGYVLKDRLLLSAARGAGDTPLSDLRRVMLVVPTMAPLQKILEQMLSQREHIALVVDEYGGTAGIVSMEDIVETLLGMEIVDEVDSVTNMQAMARTEWKRRASSLGMTPIETQKDEVDSEDSK